MYGNKKTEKLVINPRSGIGEQRLPDMSDEEMNDLDGQLIQSADGRDYELKKVVNRDLGDGDKIVNIEAHRVASNKTLYLGDGSEVDIQADAVFDQKYLDDMYSMYFTAFSNYNILLQQKIQGEYDGKLYDEHSCFEDFCRDSLDRIKEQREILKTKHNVGNINARENANALQILDMSESTLRRFLEGQIEF